MCACMSHAALTGLFRRDTYDDEKIDLLIFITAHIVEEGEFVSTSNDNPNIPIQYQLHQNYPNPLNPTTKIQYELPQRSEVQITVFDLLGRKVTTLVSETQPAGFCQSSCHSAWF